MVLSLLATTLTKGGYEQFVGGVEDQVDQFSKDLRPNRITE